MSESKYNPTSRKYYKTNFVDLIELITPDTYQTEDLKVSGVETNPVSQVINSHINVAKDISTIIPLSSIPNSTQTSALNTINGIAPYFIKQNKLTNIDAYAFESKILLPLGSSLGDFDTSAAFETFLSSTLLPIIIPPSPTEAISLTNNMSTLSSLTNSMNASGVHNYLIDALGWFYFLNTSATGGLTFSPSSFVLSSLNSLYLGKTLDTVDGIKGLVEYLWRNNETCSFGSYIPTDFVSGTADGITESSAGTLPTYTSGTQRLDALKTLVDVVYSPLYLDNQDYTVKNAFDNYIDAGLQLTNTAAKGPYRKFSNLMGFNFADISNQIENLGLIYDIENVQADHLQYIADLIGFKLRGNSPAKWRHQLRLAVDLYKSSGTIKAIQASINALITDSVFDVSGQVQELWESYLPHLIWYALGTGSELFENLNTWTPRLARESGVNAYSTSSLEDNLKIVTDSILLDLYKAFPRNFLFHGQAFDSPRLYVVDNDGNRGDLYTVVGDPAMKPFHIHTVDSNGFQARKQDARRFGESNAFKAATGFGALGEGVYMAGREHPSDGSRPIYLQPDGDLNFVFNYRGKQNFPIPPFEEVKYYRDSTVTADMVSLLVERLKCFRVKSSFANQVGDYILNTAVTDDSDLGTLNEFLMFTSSVQIPPNFDDVMLNISDYEKNLIGLWNGKSSHLFINFKDTEFDFSKSTLEGDGRYALYEASRVAREYSPAHAINRVNLTASADDLFEASSTKFEYLGFDRDDTRASYTSASVLGNFEFSGTYMSFADGGGDGNQSASGGREYSNTFKRDNVSLITDTLLSSTAFVGPVGNVSRRALRRRNLRYLLPHEGYYDRTGFNGPVSYDPSAIEHSQMSSLGELTLGYVASAGKFYPVVDPINPSGVWHTCEGLESSRSFSGVTTSATFPYRGLSSLGSNALSPEEGAATARYIDRGQVPRLYNTMHELLEAEALGYATEQIKLAPSSYDVDSYWKNNSQSFANLAIASGYVLSSFSDYENFRFGKGLQYTHKDYAKYFAKHPLGLNAQDDTGGNIFGQIFGLGLYNCNFSVDGSAVTNMIAPTADSASAINTANVWNEVEAYKHGTTVASGANDSVVPLSGTWDPGKRYNADFRNPHILSGVEFCDISGAPSFNQFSIFKLDSSTAVKGIDNPLIANTVIKCKSVGGLPRIRFDLSSYGERRNYFIKDHKFKLNINGLVAEESSPILGGGKIGVWIHTTPVSGVMWNWTSNQKWESIETNTLSIPLVLNKLSHVYDYGVRVPGIDQENNCLGNHTEDTGINNVSLNNIKSEYFEDFEITFDTRNFTVDNNSEYLEIIDMPNDIYRITNQVNRDDTNYIVEIFFLPNSNDRKYLLIDTINLEDVTQRENAGIGTGRGVETSGVPLRRFVKEEKLYLDKEQLSDVLKFYNGLMGQATGLYSTNLASRDATITSGTLEVSGGSRLNYRIQPDWTPGFTKQSNYNNYTNLEFDN